MRVYRDDARRLRAELGLAFSVVDVALRRLDEFLEVDSSDPVHAPRLPAESPAAGSRAGSPAESTCEPSPDEVRRLGNLIDRELLVGDRRVRRLGTRRVGEGLQDRLLSQDR